jgi:pimeloyl-ACP methyl ester carboxylesterase
MNVALRYTSHGDAPGTPIVILHGLLGSSGNWRSIARRLAAQHRVFALDLRNHGESPHLECMSYAAMADDVRGFLDSHDIDAATIIGHSMGGKTAMRLALDAPQRVERLVVVDIAPAVSHHDHLPWLRAMACLDLGRVSRRADADAMLATTVPDTAMRQFLLQNLVASGAGFAWRVNLVAIENSMPELLDFPLDADQRPFAGPTLFLRGAQSDYVLPGDETVIQSLFPGARIVTIEGAGHWLHAEQPARFLAALDGL